MSYIRAVYSGVITERKRAEQQRRRSCVTAAPEIKGPTCLYRPAHEHTVTSDHDHDHGSPRLSRHRTDATGRQDPSRLFSVQLFSCSGEMGERLLRAKRSWGTPRKECGVWAKAQARKNTTRQQQRSSHIPQTTNTIEKLRGAPQPCCHNTPGELAESRSYGMKSPRSSRTSVPYANCLQRWTVDTFLVRGV